MTHRQCGRHSGFGRTPAKGTKARQALLLMLRPGGATYSELFEVYSPKNNKDHISNLVSCFVNEKGWDIRTFVLPETDPRFVKKKAGRPRVIHRIVGKMRWDGSYRSFVNPQDNRPSLRRR